MKIYISGPIDSKVKGETRESNKARFNQCEEWVLENRTAWEPVNPLKVGPSCGEDACGELDGHLWECWLKGDIHALLDCQAILLLPHYEVSRGAMLELYIARHVNMFIYDTKNLEGLKFT